jgi:DNA-binding transcriptional LysR family regulator
VQKFTITELMCFDAVADEGSFQAAAVKLHRTHPSVFAAVGKLERQAGLRLLDRTSYRVTVTDIGRSFQRQTKKLLRNLDALNTLTAQLAMGEETDIRVVIGDLCPLPETLGLLNQFFDNCPNTRLHLHFESISGPWERLFDGEADLILHHVNKSDQRLEFIDLYPVQVVPVVAPGFLPFPVSDSLTPDQMQGFVQCIIRDSARHTEPPNYFLIEGAHSCTVADQLMKKQIILQGMGWGHMPRFLVESELASRQLLSIQGRHFPGVVADIVAARRRGIPHGPMANRLWRFIDEQAAGM